MTTTTAQYTQIATRIVFAQASVIGSLAYDLAKSVKGVRVQSDTMIEITGDGRQVLTDLVAAFETLLGQASVEVCKEAVRQLHVTTLQEDLPDVLR